MTQFRRTDEVLIRPLPATYPAAGAFSVARCIGEPVASRGSASGSPLRGARANADRTAPPTWPRVRSTSPITDGGPVDSASLHSIPDPAQPDGGGPSEGC